MKVKTQTWDILIGLMLIITALNLVIALYDPTFAGSLVFALCVIVTLIIVYVGTYPEKEEEKEV